MLFKFIDAERLIHSIKTAIACIVGLLLSKLIGFPADQWVVITIIVVMCAQLYVGSVLQKAYLRFFGTCIGCLFAVIVIQFIDNSFTMIATTIGVSAFLFSYLSTSQDKYSYAGTLGGVTTAIILLGQKNEPTIAFALERFLEISLGIFIATIVSQFILPIHARTHLRRAQGTTLRELRDLYQTALMSPTTQPFVLNYLEQDENIVKSLSKQRQLVKESSHEPKGPAFDPDNFMHSFYCEKEMLRAIDFMHDAQLHITQTPESSNAVASIKTFHQEVISSLSTLIDIIETKHPDLSYIDIPKLDHIKARANQNFYINGFIFAAEIFLQHLEKLATHYHLTAE